MPVSADRSRDQDVLVNSHGSATCIFMFVIMKRINVGNSFISALSLRGKALEAKASSACFLAPVPPGTIGIGDETYFEAQAHAALNPTKTNAFNSGSALEGGDLWDYLRPFVFFPVSNAISPPVYILSLIYLDRVMEHKAECFLHSLNSRRLILAAFIVAIKFHEDVSQCYDEFAFIGGLSKSKVSSIERSFLEAVNYRLFVSDEEYKKAELRLLNEALNGKHRYALCHLLRDENIPAISRILRNTEEKIDNQQRLEEVVRSRGKDYGYPEMRLTSNTQSAKSNSEPIPDGIGALRGNKSDKFQVQYYTYCRALKDHVRSSRPFDY